MNAQSKPLKFNKPPRTPFREDVFGPYDAVTKAKLEKLSNEFGEECQKQLDAFPERYVDSFALLAIAIQSSEVMFRNPNFKGRQAYLKQWKEQFGIEGEDPKRAMVRFLLSDVMRNGRDNGEYKKNHAGWNREGAWVCFAPSGGIRLYSVAPGGNVLMNYSEMEPEKDITDLFTKFVGGVELAMK